MADTQSHICYVMYKCYVVMYESIPNDVRFMCMIDASLFMMLFMDMRFLTSNVSLYD